MNYGVQQCLQSLLQNKVITSINYQVSQVITSYTKTVSNIQDCQFKVLLVNKAGSSITVSFGVSYQKKNKSMSLTSYFLESSSSYSSSTVVIANYDSNEGGQVDLGTCKKYTEEEVNDDENCQEAIDWSVEQFNQQVQSGFVISQIQNVYQDMVNINNYRVVATLENSKGEKADCTFSVNYGAASGANNSMNSASYILY
jgi:hypothetical protein